MIHNLINIIQGFLQEIQNFGQLSITEQLRVMGISFAVLFFPLSVILNMINTKK